MNRVLSFKPHLCVEPAGDQMVFVVGEHERFLLRGRVQALVAPLIDGRRSEWEIIAALEGAASPPEVFYVLATLERNGYLIPSLGGVAPEIAPQTAAFWHGLGKGAVGVAERLADTPVTVVAVAGEDRRPLVEALVKALAGAGVRVEADADAALRVVLTGDYLDPALDALNRQALAQGFGWMPVKLTGTTPWLGPMFRPRSGPEQAPGPCWQCLAHRLRGNRPVETFVARMTGQEIRAPRALLPTSAWAAIALAALALARWVVDSQGGGQGDSQDGGRGGIDSTLLALDLGRFRIDEHTVVRRPQCPACGDPKLMAKRAETPPALAPRPKGFTDDGGYRAVDPETTFARYEHLISPITGVVTSLGPLAPRNHPLRPVHAAAYFQCPPASRAPDFDAFTRTSLGKGRTAAQSRAGALCEALERISAVFQGDEAHIRARIGELGDAAVHPGALQHFSPSQYRRRDELNTMAPEQRKKIPLCFDDRADEVAIDWTPAWSLATGKKHYLPAAYCYLHWPVPDAEEFCYLDPNGHAAGNCLEEAILQGFLELAERDAVGIWWYNRVKRPAVDLASFAEPYFMALERHYRDMGYRLWVLDLTNDLQIPAFVALARSTATGAATEATTGATTNRWCVGFGCHLEARLGVQRALTELNQLFDPTSDSPAPWDHSGIVDSGYLLPDDGQPARRCDQFPALAGGDLLGDVQACVERVAGLGLDMLVIDQTRPDIGLYAVKVVVPGLRHIWPRLGPGRLYDVPARMGWLEEPRAEDELNPVPLYL